MSKLIVIVFLFTLSCAKVVEITPSEVYAETIKIEREIEILKKHFKLNYKFKPQEIDAKLYPRHSFQATYMLLARISVFREKMGLSITIEPDIAPSEELDPHDVYEATQRILVELYILKKRLGVTESIEGVGKFNNKTPTDVFNKLF